MKFACLGVNIAIIIGFCKCKLCEGGVILLKINQERQASLDRLLKLRYSAIALKFVEDESVVPNSAFRPFRDKGKHIALCQAFALARRQGRVVYMRKEDHWCWNPLITYGMVDFKRGNPDFELISGFMGIPDKEKADDFVDAFPKLPYGKYEGTLIAPLEKADFEPDIMLIYSSNSQLRFMLMGLITQTGSMLESEFTPLDSCVYSVIPPYLEGKYRITLPDPGEYERALTDENDIIFTVPYQKMEEFFAGLAQLDKRGQTLNSFYPYMKEDFQRPGFYNQLFDMWGLQTGELWEK